MLSRYVVIGSVVGAALSVLFYAEIRIGGRLLLSPVVASSPVASAECRGCTPWYRAIGVVQIWSAPESAQAGARSLGCVVNDSRLLAPDVPEAPRVRGWQLVVVQTSVSGSDTVHSYTGWVRSLALAGPSFVQSWPVDWRVELLGCV